MCLYICWAGFTARTADAAYAGDVAYAAYDTYATYTARRSSFPRCASARTPSSLTAMGDMLQQQDGRLLLSYVREVYTPISDDHGPELVARYSSDQGKTWGEPVVLVPALKPPAK